jgi:HK97 family phage portal protein
MGLMNLFKRKLTDKDLDLIAKKLSAQNKLYRSLQAGIAQGTLLDRDYDTQDYIDKGFEGNPDVYAAIQFAAVKFAFVPGQLKREKKSGKKEVIKNHEFLDRINRPNHYQTLFEFKMLWELFRLVTGNSLIYAPRIQAGNNKGRLMKDGLFIMPTQYTEIKSGGWREPIGKYVMEFDAFRNEMDPSDVIHDRFPTMQYEQGRQFFGLSPIKAAIEILERQNAGYERGKDMYKQGGPPGILVDSTMQETPSPEQKTAFRKEWKKVYGDGRNTNVPMLTNEGVQWIPVGFDSIKELDIVNTSQDARRALATIIHIPTQLLNDPSASTYNNMTEAKKDMWNNRLKVDHRAFYERITRDILPAYGENLSYEPDYSDIDELQEDKKTKTEWLQKAYDSGVINGNEFRTMLDLEPDENDQHLSSYYINMNKIPAEQAFTSDVLEPTNEEDKAYSRMQIQY